MKTFDSRAESFGAPHRLHEGVHTKEALKEEEEEDGENSEEHEADDDDDDGWIIDQDRNALIAKLAVELPRLYIKEGRKRAIDAFKPRVISKKEYNDSRKRDFRLGKGDGQKSSVTTDGDDEISMAMFQEHPNAFMRDYKKTAFETGTLKYLHSGLWSYEFIRCIDISGLAVGDEGFKELCAGIGNRCPVETLVLTGNNITDRGLEIFSGVCRSLGKLQNLILNENKFGDRGVAALFHPHRYPSSVRLVNLSKNRLNIKSAYFIGLMFLKERSSALEELVLGIKMGNTSLGDNFLRVLGAMLLAPGARPLRRLDIGDFGMGLLGLNVIVTLLLSSSHLEELSMSRNYLPPRGRALLYRALRMNRSLLVFHGSYCGFEPHEEMRLKELGFLQARPCGAPIANVVTSIAPTNEYKELLSKFKRPQLAPLSWEESVELASICLRTSYACAHHLKTVMQGISTSDKPPPPTETKLFAGAARGKMSVMQQTSLYGAKALRATPLKEEMEKLEYLYERLAPQSFAEAMGVLQCELQDSEARSDLTSPWDFVMKPPGTPMAPGISSDFQSLFHASSPRKITPDFFKESDLEDKSTDTIVLFYDKKPLVLFKLVSPDLLVLERWLDYLKILHVDKYRYGIIPGVDVEFASQVLRFYKFYEVVRSNRDLIDATVVPLLNEYYLAKFLRSTSAEVVTDAQGEWSRILLSVGVNILPVVAHFPWRKNRPRDRLPNRSGATTPKSRELEHGQGLDEYLQAEDGALLPGEDDQGASSRPSTQTPSRPGTQASKGTNGAKKEQQANTVRKITGHAFLWTYSQLLYSENHELNAEIASMALEDYSSSIYRAVQLGEELISTNLIGAPIDLDILSQDLLPAPTSYVYQCLTGALRPVTKQVNKSEQAIELINQRRNLKKASRGGQRVTGSRFTVRSDPPGSRGSGSPVPRSRGNAGQEGADTLLPIESNGTSGNLRGSSADASKSAKKSKKEKSSPKKGQKEKKKESKGKNRKQEEAAEIAQQEAPPAPPKKSFLPPIFASLFGMK